MTVSASCEQYKVATMDQKDLDIFYVLEDTSFFNRFCLGGLRPWEMVSFPNTSGLKGFI